MNKVVQILMTRDEIDQETAEALVRETRDELLNLENPLEADDIIREYLELEPDYIFDILDMK
jgi:hypothetical protein